MCVKNIKIFYVESTKKNIFLSFHSLIFHSKIHKYLRTFFERGWGKPLKKMFVGEGGGTCKMNKDKKRARGGWGGVKN